MAEFNFFNDWVVFQGVWVCVCTCARLISHFHPFICWWALSLLLCLQFSQFSSVAQSCLTLLPHRLQHARPPCLSPTPGVYSNSCPLSWWCHPTISSSVIPSPPSFNLSQHQGLFCILALINNAAVNICVHISFSSFVWVFNQEWNCWTI